MCDLHIFHVLGQYIDQEHVFFHDWEAACVPIEVCRYLAMLPVRPAPHIKGDEV